MTILKHYDFEVSGFREFASLPSAVPKYAEAINALDPLAYWRLGEASGPTLADQTAAHPLTLSGSYTLSQDGALATDLDDAIRFNGGKAETVSPVFPGGASAAFSIAFWIRVPGTISQGGTIISQLDVGDPGHLRVILLTSGQVRYVIVGDNVVQTSSAASTDWHMLVFTRSTTGTGRWYFDGQLDAELTGQTTAVYQTKTRIGTIAGSAPDVFLDELAIFDDELSADQARWLYSLGTGQLALPPGI